MLQRAATAALQASSSHPPNASLLLLLPLSSAAVRILIVIWTTDLRFYLSALFFSCWATALIRCALRLRKQIFFFFSEQKGQKWLEGFMTKSPAPLTENVELLSLKVQDCISILLSLPLWTSVQLSQGRTTVSWAAAVMWIWSFWKGGGAWIVSQENSKSSSAIVPCLASPSFNSYCCFLLSTGSSL